MNAGQYWPMDHIDVLNCYERWAVMVTDEQDPLADKMDSQ